MRKGKKMVVVKKIETKLVNGNMVSEDFDISDTINTMEGYWFIDDESRVEFKDDSIYLILAFSKKVEDNREKKNIEDIIPTYKIKMP